MFSEERCPYCGCEDYTVDNYWDDFNEVDGVREWKCICQKCHACFDITYTYKCTKITVS